MIRAGRVLQELRKNEVMSRTALFFPWPLGAGHTGRCLATARILAGQGYRSIFVGDATGGLIAREGFATVREGQVRHRVKPTASGYIVVPSLDACFAGVGYYQWARIWQHVEEDLALIREVKPDLVVTHMQPTCVIAAGIEGTPVVSIADGDFLRPGPCAWMPWLPQHAIGRLIPFRSSLPAFNKALAQAGAAAIEDVCQLMWTDAVLVGGTPETDPVEIVINEKSTVDFVGPLIWDPNQREIAARLAGFGVGRPRIYVTGGSGELFSRQMATAAADMAESNDWAVFLATGYHGELGSKAAANLLVNTFGGIRSALEWCDVVVCHGGHSTVMGALAAGKPIVVVPTMSETECNGRSMVVKSGAGVLLCESTWQESTGRLKILGRYSDSGDLITADSMARAVNELLGQPGYKSAANAVAAGMAPWIIRSKEVILASVGRLAAVGA
jgi:UDP:flavonoid glycosyltransferase YjiC (YdhE family)